MAGSRTNNTFSEEVFRLIQTVAGMRVLPDADLDFVTKLEDLLTTKARLPEQSAQAQGMMPPGAQNPMGNAALGLPGMPPLPPGPPPGPGPMPPPMGMPPMDMGMSSPLSSQLGAGAPPGVMPPPGSPQGGAPDLASILAGV